jgi:HEAT repeat protein
VSLASALPLQAGPYQNTANRRVAPDRKEAADPRENAAVEGKLLSQVIREMQDRDPSVREQAIRSVVLYRADARAALPALITELRDSDAGLRYHATVTIGLLGLDEKNLKTGVSGLAGLLKDTQGVVRREAAIALGRIGPAANAALPGLILLTKDPYSWTIRQAAVVALRTVAQDKSGPDSRVVTALTTALGDSSAEVRLETVNSLILLGPPANAPTRTSAVQALQRLFNDRDPRVALWSHVALMRLDQITDQHLSVVARGLRAPDPLMREQAARALGTVGDQAKARVPDLLEVAQKDKEPAVVETSLWALARMGPEGKSALTQLTKHTDKNIQNAAKEVLSSLTTAAPPSEPPKAKQ